LADGVLTREAYGILRFRLSQFWGTYRGYRQTSAVDQQLRRRFYYPETRQIRLPQLRREEARIHYDRHAESATLKE
jgi:hypothetical protein